MEVVICGHSRVNVRWLAIVIIIFIIPDYNITHACNSYSSGRGLPGLDGKLVQFSPVPNLLSLSTPSSVQKVLFY